MEVPAMLRRSVEEFGSRVSQVRDDQWEAGTPDTEWNVRDSDGSVIFSLSPALTGGSKKTAEFAINEDWEKQKRVKALEGPANLR